jgi:RHS repeat-associated protein
MNPGFATYHNDCSSGLEYAMNRYYDSARGRFNTPDPSSSSYDLKDPLSFNRYAYGMGDPINKNDPTGLCPDDSSDDGSDDGSVDDSGGGGGGGDEDEIGDGREMDIDAFGHHGRSKRRIRAMGNDPVCTPIPTTACPAGQTLMSNGQCDVPLSSGAQQVVSQAGRNLGTICSVLEGGSDWTGGIVGLLGSYEAVSEIKVAGPLVRLVGVGSAVDWVIVKAICH